MEVSDSIVNVGDSVGGCFLDIFWISLISIGFLLDVFWILFGCLVVDVLGKSFGFLLDGLGILFYFFHFFDFFDIYWMSFGFLLDVF